MIQCKICSESFDNYNYLSSHLRFKHQINSFNYSLKYNHNNIIPKCSCGCNNETKWVGLKEGFNKFIKGHASKFQLKKLPIYNNICTICGNEFKTNDKKKNYCSKQKSIKYN